jgi:hypothetical protein
MRKGMNNMEDKYGDEEPEKETGIETKSLIVCSVCT